MEARADTVTVTLPDGSTRSVPRGTTVREVAQGIGPRLARDAWAGKLGGKVVDLVTPIESDAPLEIITGKSPDAVPIYRHSTAHLTAQAVKRLFPDVQIGIGPPIENGYYYDFNPARPFTPEDLAAIEAEMRKIIGEDLPIERMDMPLEEAVAIFEKQGDALKVEIAKGIPEGERVSCYRQGEFVDLCRGPHVASTGKLGVFKLTHTAGAYWKGDEHNPMLQRIYGASFLTQKELDEYLKRMEEAKERDHRKLGKELDLFSFHPWAPASPFFHPKGRRSTTASSSTSGPEYAARGYQEVVTPQIFDAELFKLSGHYANYHENMYWTEIDEREFGVKPMNCPGHFLLYKTRLWSYRDLPVRFADFGRLHRYELSGVTAGLTRVRTFSQDDAHIFTPFEKVEDEIFRFLDFVDAVYGAFGFTDVEISLGLRPEKRIGADELWDRGEAALAAALEKAKRPHVVTPGDGAFYGPKIDFRVKDALGRPWQLGTIQCDFEHAESFDLTYIGEDGQSAPPGRHAPRDPRLLRALPRHPDRAHRGELPVLDRPGPRGRAARLRPVRGPGARSRREAFRRGPARRAGRPQREARRAHPEGGNAEDPRHARHRRKGGRGRHGFRPAAARGRRGDAPGGRVSFARPQGDRGEEGRTDRGGEESIRKAFVSTNRSGGRRSA